MEASRFKLIEAIEKVSFLPKLSTKILVVLAKHNAPLPTKIIAKISGVSNPEVVLNRLLKQRIITKVKTIFPCNYWMIDKNWENNILEIYENSFLYIREDNK